MTRIVLIADPDHQLRQKVALAFHSAGWHVLDVASGEAATGLVRALLRPVDLVVTSIKLSGKLSGRDVVQEVQRLSPTARAIYTAETADFDAQAGTFCAKPYDPLAMVSLADRD